MVPGGPERRERPVSCLFPPVYEMPAAQNPRRPTAGATSTPPPATTADDGDAVDRNRPNGPGCERGGRLCQLACVPGPASRNADGGPWRTARSLHLSASRRRGLDDPSTVVLHAESKPPEQPSAQRPRAAPGTGALRSGAVDEGLVPVCPASRLRRRARRPAVYSDRSSRFLGRGVCGSST